MAAIFGLLFLLIASLAHGAEAIQFQGDSRAKAYRVYASTNGWTTKQLVLSIPQPNPFPADKWIKGTIPTPLVKTEYVAASVDSKNVERIRMETGMFINPAAAVAYKRNVLQPPPGIGAQ